MRQPLQETDKMVNESAPEAAAIRDEILRLSRQYSALIHRGNLPAQERYGEDFVPGISHVPYAGRVFDADEVAAAIDSTLEFWLTLGKNGEAFERMLAKQMGVRKTLLTNSGSSANLLAISALTSHKLGSRRLVQGDEVITVAAGFPTTVAPISQNGLVPVFIDNDRLTLNACTNQLDSAYVAGKTKAVMMAHTLGNSFDLAAVTSFCEQHGLWLIEDNCDSLGSTYDNLWTGTFGHLSTQSFYPPHHLTLGEGGAVNIVKDMLLKTLVESFRDWGRDCWCPSGQDNTCNKRFCWQLGELPEGFDHKYTYSHLGYNLKPLDIQAAIGIAQLGKLDSFSEARRANWSYLRAALAEFEDFFEFQLPTHATSWGHTGFAWDDSGHRTDPSWFGFMLGVRKDAPFTRTELAQQLDKRNIGNRMLFGGNLTKQPAFVALQKSSQNAFRVAKSCEGADHIMNNVLFTGVYPGLTKAMLDYVVESVADFVRNAKTGKLGRSEHSV
jgi:CDP-6-deoxy-D-xylo-4-hexulose-3-dehydrase